MIECLSNKSLDKRRHDPQLLGKISCYAFALFIAAQDQSSDLSQTSKTTLRALP